MWAFFEIKRFAEENGKTDL